MPSCRPRLPTNACGRAERSAGCHGFARRLKPSGAGGGNGTLAQLVERRVHTAEVTGSSPVRPTTGVSVSGPVAQLDRALASEARGRRFDSCLGHHTKPRRLRTEHAASGARSARGGLRGRRPGALRCGGRRQLGGSQQSLEAPRPTQQRAIFDREGALVAAADAAVRGGLGLRGTSRAASAHQAEAAAKEDRKSSHGLVTPRSRGAPVE